MYKALYRKYRPLSFDDVVSQPQVTQTLRNQLVSGKTAHAYLFTGSRGTGKTTCARILAKAMNCLNPKDGNPCLECEICRDADSGALSDIIEIDAASNSSVDDIRDLREGTVYTPERCKYKVYIIDEVHMLSSSAFNALLKIMEEPPSHVKFILATTEVHKVLPTILSRCQRFDFRRILSDDIKKRLMYVAANEGISLNEDAAELIAKTADGGMRDALSLLDQCIAFSDNVTAEVVANAAGIAGGDYIFSLVSAIIKHDAAGAIMIIRQLYELSKDMQKLCDELISCFRDIMIAKTVPDNTDALACMPSEIERIKGFADELTMEEIFSKLDALQNANERVARVSAKRVEIEMCMIRLCRAGEKQHNDSVLDNSEIYAKIDMLEKKLSDVTVRPLQGYTAPPSHYAQPPCDYNGTSRPAQTARTAVQTEERPVEFKDLNPADFKPVRQWAEILEEFTKICPSGSGALVGSYALENRGYMLVFSENSFFMNVLRNKDNAAKLMEAAMKVTGRAYSIRARCTAKKDNEESPVESLLKKAQTGGIPTESD